MKHTSGAELNRAESIVLCFGQPGYIVFSSSLPAAEPLMTTDFGF